MVMLALLVLAQALTLLRVLVLWVLVLWVLVMALGMCEMMRRAMVCAPAVRAMLVRVQLAVAGRNWGYYEAMAANWK